MIVSVDEFISEFDKYLDLVQHENIFITDNEKIIAQMTGFHESAVDSLRGLIKNAPSDVDYKLLREERNK